VSAAVFYAQVKSDSVVYGSHGSEYRINSVASCRWIR